MVACLGVSEVAGNRGADRHCVRADHVRELLRRAHASWRPCRPLVVLLCPPPLRMELVFASKEPALVIQHHDVFNKVHAKQFLVQVMLQSAMRFRERSEDGDLNCVHQEVISPDRVEVAHERAILVYWETEIRSFDCILNQPA